jgi:hypothetical protein
VCVPPHPQRLEAGIVKPEKSAIVRQGLSKHVPAATNTHATLEKLLNTVFFMQSVLYKIIFSERKHANSSENF